MKSPSSSIVKASKYTGLTNYLPFASYALPSNALYGNTTAYGNVSRNILRSFAFYNTDLGLHKQFPILRERYKLDLRAETFNILNHTSWQGPDGAITDGSGSFGSITSAFPARQIQLAAKFLF